MEPRATVLRQLARIYDVPLNLFIDPPPTDEERLDAIARIAEQERADWEAGQGRDREDEDGPGAALRRRSGGSRAAGD